MSYREVAMWGVLNVLRRIGRTRTSRPWRERRAMTGRRSGRYVATAVELVDLRSVRAAHDEAQGPRRAKIVDASRITPNFGWCSSVDRACSSCRTARPNASPSKQPCFGQWKRLVR
jgi:hypothetical protein